MKRKKQSIDCHAAIEALKYWKGDLYLPANKVYTLIIDYPFDKPGRYNIKTGKGMGLAALFSAIYKAYVKQYTCEPDADDRSKLITLDVGS